MAEAVVSFAVERLGDLLIQDASFLYEATDKVAEIQAELRRMTCFLKDADARRNENELIRNLVAEIREVAYDAEDVIETFAFKVALRRRSGLRNQLRRYACIFSEFKALHEVGTEIDAIKTKISSLTANIQRYNIRSFSEGESSSSSSRNDQRQQLLRRTYSHLDDEDTIGVEDSVKILVEQLVKPDQRCSVVSICGMGGLGKTTLARKVYHDVDIRRHFDHFAWSSISQQFNIRDVVVGILIKLTSADEEQRTKIEKLRDDEIFKEVYEIQEQRKCLVILDDVWKVQDWERLKPSFPLQKVAAGSKILLTTRNQAVALHVDPGCFLYRPKLLSEEESWELLRRKAFTRGHGPDPTNNNIELWGREMAKYCGGLPLAVVVLGGLLATKNTFDEWDRVHRNVKSYLRRGKNNYEEKQGSGGVLDVLKLSYQDLPYQLKSCFLYLGHFPEDYEIPSKRLVQMWVAEGIISRVGEETLEDIAESYLDELIGRCMVQEGARSSNGRVKTCCLHDLMRDLCLSEAKEENFLEIINLQPSETFSSSMVTTTTSNNVRRCAIYLNGYVDIGSVGEGRVVSKNSDENANRYVNLNPKKGTHLRSLLIFYPPNIWQTLSMGKFKLLRVLSLERLKFKEKNLKGIGNLIHLKYLSFKYAVLLSFPSSIRNLGCIQMLDLRLRYGASLSGLKIHDVICGMKWLKHLYLPRYLGMDSSKVQWDKLSNLETLVFFNAKQCDVKDLASLTKIRKLKITGIESFKELEVILKPSCPISSNLRSLALIHLGTKMEETDLRPLSECRQLYKLYLGGGPISNLPSHHHFPPNLTNLTLSNLRLEQDPIPILEKLLNLTILRLSNKFYTGEEMVFSTNGFPQLKYLGLSSSFSLRRLLVEKSAMPSLKHFRIHGCRSLKMVPEGLRSISTLQILEIHYMPEEFIQRLQVINGKEGEDFYKVRHVPFISLIAGNWVSDEKYRP